MSNIVTCKLKWLLQRGHGDHLKVLQVFILFGHHFIIANTTTREAEKYSSSAECRSSGGRVNLLGEA